MFVVAPDYKVPIRNTIKSRIEKIYDDQKPVLVRNLEDVDSISLTTDTWTSNANKSYLTVAEHHIDKTWNIIPCIIVYHVGYFPTQMEFRHNRFELIRYVICCMSFWNLTDH
jgi:hypothetical protein